MTRSNRPADELVPENLPTGLAAPARRALAQTGYFRLDQLTLVRESDLLKMHGIGPKAIDQLRAALAEQGLSLADEPKP